MMNQQITLAALTNLLLNARHGANFITFVAKTEPDMIKTGSPFRNDNVELVAKVNAQINFHYDSAVLRQLEREGKSPEDFKKGESWHTPVLIDNCLTPLCQHKSKPTLYLRVRLLDVLEAQYYVNGVVADNDMVKPWVRKNKVAYENQGTEKPIKFKVYKLEGIQSLTMNGVTYEVRG
jgi:hypothetical protein